MFLKDEQLVSLDEGVIKGINRQDELFGAKSPFQPCSIDLKIGKIYVPESESSEPGSVEKPLIQNFYLQPGQTAIVETKEELNLPNNLAAIGFPPSSVSSQGIIMTNPGHVDPGYHGTMKFTVINMGRQPFKLQAGEIIVTLLFFDLESSVKAGYKQRYGDTIHTGVSFETLSKLSADFLDFERRAENVAKRSERKAAYWGIGAPVVVTLITLFITLYATNIGIKEKIAELDGKIDSKYVEINNKLKYLDIEDRLKKVEQQLKHP